MANTSATARRAVNTVRPPGPALHPPRACTFDPSDWRILAALWQPLAYLDEPGADRMLVRRVLDVDLACWRSDPAPGAPIMAALDFCPRSRGRLSGAAFAAGTLTAPLGGVRYRRADGAAMDDPAAPGLVILLTRAAHGMLWVCLSGEPTHELPAWPELADTRTLKQMRLEPLEWACNISRQVENFMDVAHLSWLHTGTFGNRERPEIPAYHLHELPDGAGYRFDVRYPRKSVEAHATDAGRGQVEDITLDYDLHLPFCTRLVIRFPDGTCYRIYNFPAAVSRKRCRIFIRMARDFDLDGPADSSIDLQMRVLAEDQPMVESQRPEEIPLDLTEEFHIAADRLSAAYRRSLRALGLGHPLSS